MWDANQTWQSDMFKKMLCYERDNAREKFIYEVNQLLNAYSNLDDNLKFLIRSDDTQLLSLIFSLISITYNKDELSDFIKNEDLSDYMNQWLSVNDEFSTTIVAHTFRKMPEKNLNIGEQFTIPASTLTIYVPNESGSGNRVFEINDWEFNYDNNILSINNGVVTAIKKGCTIIECVNKKYNESRRIKINSGNIKQSHITEFFFTQIRNIIAHGRFSIVNSGSYDTLDEYGSFNMLPSDNRYMRGSQRDLYIFENNQLNIAYGKENAINPKYLVYLAKTLYARENNPFVKFIEIFDSNNDMFQIKRKHPSLKLNDDENFMALIELSKFYINFIYNYDSYDKDNYDYSKLPISNALKGNHTNKEFIYEIRTAIMHGRYVYKNNEFRFWNIDKNDSNLITFDVRINYKDFETIFIAKEEEFYEKMKYNPNELVANVSSKKL